MIGLEVACIKHRSIESKPVLKELSSLFSHNAQENLAFTVTIAFNE